jgi:hypothetical protein
VLTRVICIKKIKKKIKEKLKEKKEKKNEWPTKMGWLATPWVAETH